MGPTPIPAQAWVPTTWFLLLSLPATHLKGEPACLYDDCSRPPRVDRCPSSPTFTPNPDSFTKKTGVGSRGSLLPSFQGRVNLFSLKANP